MKALLNLVAIVLISVGWFSYWKNYLSADQIQAALVEVEESGATEEEILEAETRLDTDQQTNVFTGILLTFLTAGYVGTLFVLYILPMLAHRATQSIYDSTEQVGEDALSAARSKLAQGDYEGAITAFHTVIEEEPMNRVPYLEIAKIQRTSLEDPDAAILTLSNAIQSQEWEESDAAFLMFRLAEIFQEDKNDLVDASSVMQQVVDQFPATRHSANAQSKLQEWARETNA